MSTSRHREILATPAERVSITREALAGLRAKGADQVLIDALAAHVEEMERDLQAGTLEPIFDEHDPEFEALIKEIDEEHARAAGDAATDEALRMIAD